MPEPQRILLIGASSGIGAALAVELAAPGRSLVLVARRRAELEAVGARVRARGAAVNLECWDATADEDTEACFARCVTALGGLDTVVYSAGVLPAVGLDEFDTGKDRHMVQVNLVGAMAWLNPAARMLSKQGRGTICGIGSVAGDRGRRPKPGYGATKAALHTYLESLTHRLGPLGVAVVTIKPGPIATPMTADHGEPPFMIPADVAARRIARAIVRGERVVYVPAVWRPVMAVIRALPWFLFKRFVH